MILVTAKVEDFDRFVGTFSTRGAEKRKQLGSRGSRLYRDPDDSGRVWVVFDWDAEDYAKFLTDPEVPAIFKDAGLEGPPVQAEPAGEYEA